MQRMPSNQSALSVRARVGTPTAWIDGGLSLRKRVERALRTSGYPVLGKIEVVALGSRLVLRGRAPTYHMKQMAQVVTQGVPGVREVRNDIEVSAFNE